MSHFPQGVSPLGFGPELPSGGTEYKLWWKSTDTFLKVYRWVANPSGWIQAAVDPGGYADGSIPGSALTSSVLTLSANTVLVNAVEHAFVSSLNTTATLLSTNWDVNLTAGHNINMSATSILMQGQVVTFGANDSAGPGFRVLRVPNT
jgi:hypothetical protein